LNSGFIDISPIFFFSSIYHAILHFFDAQILSSTPYAACFIELSYFDMTFSYATPVPIQAFSQIFAAQRYAASADARPPT
jgi:hypothetical protein